MRKSKTRTTKIVQQKEINNYSDFRAAVLNSPELMWDCGFSFSNVLDNGIDIGYARTAEYLNRMVRDGEIKVTEIPYCSSIYTIIK